MVSSETKELFDFQELLMKFETPWAQELLWGRKWRKDLSADKNKYVLTLKSPIVRKNKQT